MNEVIPVTNKNNIEGTNENIEKNQFREILEKCWSAILPILVAASGNNSEYNQQIDFQVFDSSVLDIQTENKPS